jgi:hypothetical protein
MPHVPERTLTILVLVEAIQLFLVAPLSAEFAIPPSIFLIVLAATVVLALCVVWHLRAAIVAVVAAAIIECSALGLRLFWPSHAAASLDLAALLVLIVTILIVSSAVVFGPGRVNVHRIVGAIGVYLNVAAAFAVVYRIIYLAGASNFSSLHPIDGHNKLAAFIYYSFTTLTTTGFGDIVPVDAVARSLSNAESVIGQLFPATLLARLITLEVAHREKEPL